MKFPRCYSKWCGVIMPNGKAVPVFPKLNFSWQASQIRIYVPYRFAHQLCLSPLVKIEFEPRYKNSLLFGFFSLYTGISIVVLKAACHITVHNMVLHYSCSIDSDFCIIFFFGYTVTWKAGCLSQRREETCIIHFKLFQNKCMR